MLNHLARTSVRQGRQLANRNASTIERGIQSLSTPYSHQSLTVLSRCGRKNPSLSLQGARVWPRSFSSEAQASVSLVETAQSAVTAFIAHAIGVSTLMYGARLAANAWEEDDQTHERATKVTSASIDGLLAVDLAELVAGSLTDELPKIAYSLRKFAFACQNRLLCESLLSVGVLPSLLSHATGPANIFKVNALRALAGILKNCPEHVKVKEHANSIEAVCFQNLHHADTAVCAAAAECLAHFVCNADRAAAILKHSTELVPLLKTEAPGATPPVPATTSTSTSTSKVATTNAKEGTNGEEKKQVAAETARDQQGTETTVVVSEEAPIQVTVPLPSTHEDVQKWIVVTALQIMKWQDEERLSEDTEAWDRVQELQEALPQVEIDGVPLTGKEVRFLANEMFHAGAGGFALSMASTLSSAVSTGGLARVGARLPLALGAGVIAAIPMPLIYFYILAGEVFPRIRADATSDHEIRLKSCISLGTSSGLVAILAHISPQAYPSLLLYTASLFLRKYVRLTRVPERFDDVPMLEMFEV